MAFPVSAYVASLTHSLIAADMTIAQGRLLELVKRLDQFTSEITLVELAQSLERAELQIEDVSPYIEINSMSYNRGTVVYREHYELLVMTWLPGQTSLPHDHAGSICVMQVLQGTAIEGSFQVAADGYVDLHYESSVSTGSITAGQDAGIHSVRNDKEASEALITVHIYSPPLRDFRRFNPRPIQVRDAACTRVAPQIPTVVVVGGGFSGSMTAAQLLHQANASGVKLRIVLAERRGTIGEGIAYGTRDLTHLLNVPAGKMSAWPDRADDYLKWVQQKKGKGRPSDFLPRMWYGEYIRETLLNTEQLAKPNATLNVLLDEVRRIARRPDGGWLVHLGREGSEHADAVVLAIGHRSPDDPIGKRWEGSQSRYIIDPWRPMALTAISPNDRVIVLGSGLTAVDTVLSLADPRRTAPITMISRRGFLPKAHSHSPLPPVDLAPLISELMKSSEYIGAKTLFKGLRRTAKELAKQDIDWRSVVDGMRPHTAEIWKAMPIKERRRFLTHLRHYWEVHRHRMAIGISERFGELHDCDHAIFLAGRIDTVIANDLQIKMIIEKRHRQGSICLEADWVINCTGPAPSNSAAANPAIGSLLVDGWLRPDELNLGLDTTEAGNVINRHGNQMNDLFVVGTLRKSIEWESTAVPELRVQASSVAKSLVSEFHLRQTKT